MALRADERRDKLRKVTGRSKYPLIREYLNGETHMRIPHVSIRQSITYGREPGELKHLSSRRKRKKKSISKVAASEMERAKTGARAFRGYGPQQVSRFVSGTVWEVRQQRVKAPYTKSGPGRQDPEYHETRGTLGEVGGPTPQGEILLSDRSRIVL